MGDLGYHKSIRKHMRSAVTRIYNDRGNFGSYDSVKVETTRDKLLKLRDDLGETDRVVTKLMYDLGTTETVEKDISKELTECEVYQDRINEAIHSLVIPVSTAAPVALEPQTHPRSLLKSPTAPLPEFHSQPGENFELFIHNFAIEHVCTYVY